MNQHEESRGAGVRNHPWDGPINQWGVVSSSGLRVDWFNSQSAARDFAMVDDSPGNSIHAVYGPGFGNRVAVYMGGRWYSPDEFDTARGGRAANV